MALVVKIDGYDISDRVQAAVDEFDPAKAFSDPNFAGNSLTDGDLFISMTRHNREWTIPILIVADSNDNLNATVRTINSHLKQGATLEYREDGASNSTYFDVETAVLEADYRYQRNRQGVGKFLLKVWTRPLGHTGTTRLVASAIATGYVSFPLASMNLSGDSAAAMTISVSRPSTTLNSNAELLAWGVTDRTNFAVEMTPSVGIRGTSNATQFPDGAAVGTAVIGCPSARAEMYLVPTSSLTSIPTDWAGQQIRVFMSARTTAHASGADGDNMYAPSTFPAVARVFTGLGGGAEGVYNGWKKVYGATAFAASTFHLYDLGVINVPAAASGGNSPVVGVNIYPTNIASVLASPYVRVERVYAVPVGNSGAAVAQVAQASAIGSVDYGAKSLNVSASGLDYFLQTTGAGVVGMSRRGENPEIEPAATGALVVFAGRSSTLGTAAQRQLIVNALAKEQFQFFR